MSFVEGWVCGAGGGAESAVTPSSINKHVRTHTHGE